MDHLLLSGAQRQNYDLSEYEKNDHGEFCGQRTNDRL